MGFGKKEEVIERFTDIAAKRKKGVPPPNKYDITKCYDRISASPTRLMHRR